MKLFTALLLVLALASQVFAQEDELPKAVSLELNKNFSGAEDIEWYQTGNKITIAFTYKGKEGTAVITPSGNLISYQVEAGKADLPAAVKSAVSDKYEGYPYYDIFKSFNQSDLEHFIITVELEDYSTALLSVKTNGTITSTTISEADDEGGYSDEE